MKEMKTVIGLTGGIAAGKSLASSYLKSKGYEVLDADIIAREVVKRDSAGLKKVIQAFGEEYLLNGELNRAKLGAHVFGNQEELDKLNGIMLPLINAEIDRRIAQSVGEVVFVDGATIIESGMSDKFAQIWLVECEEDTQLKRLMMRDKLSEEDALKRIKSQLPLAEKRKFARLLLPNNGGQEEFLAQIDQALQNLHNEAKRLAAKD